MFHVKQLHMYRGKVGDIAFSRLSLVVTVPKFGQ